MELNINPPIYPFSPCVTDTRLRKRSKSMRTRRQSCSPRMAQEMYKLHSDTRPVVTRKLARVPLDQLVDTDFTPSVTKSLPPAICVWGPVNAVADFVVVAVTVVVGLVQGHTVPGEVLEHNTSILV